MRALLGVLAGLHRANLIDRTTSRARKGISRSSVGELRPILRSNDGRIRECLLPTAPRCAIRGFPADRACNYCRRRTAFRWRQCVRPQRIRHRKTHLATAGRTGFRNRSILPWARLRTRKERFGNEAEAVSWFRKAAEQGLAASQAALGTRYFIGWGVPQSYAEAMNWSLKAAKQGNPSAQAILGTIYESGYGVPQNFILAYMWFTVSAHDPDFEPGTRRNLDGIARHLAPAQILAAKSLAQHCLQTSYVDCTQAPQVARRDNDAAASTAPEGNPSSRTRVPLRTDRGVSFVPVEINGTLKLDFAIDSGASDVSVPADVFSTLNARVRSKRPILSGNNRTFWLTVQQHSQPSSRSDR